MKPQNLTWKKLTADDPKRGYRRYSEQVFPPRTTVTRGVLAEECERLVRSFFAALRR